MRSSARFWDKIADKYAKQPVADEASYQRKLEITRSYLKPDMEVVELGCGTGSTAIAHAPYVRHIRAIDVSPRMIEIAQGKARSGGIRNVTFERSALEDVEIDTGSVDVVLAMSILHLVEDRDRVVEMVFEMLKPGGIFVSSTICLDDDMKWLKAIAPLGRMTGLMPKVGFFTKSDLEGCIKRQGFEIERTWKPGKRKAAFIVAKKSHR